MNCRGALFALKCSRDIEYYAKKAHAAGAKLGIDATFAPPPLQNPFKWGADIIMHSGRYFHRGIAILSSISDQVLQRAQ